jgi:hypothetical protein
MRVHFAGNDTNNINEILYNSGIRYRLNSYHYLKKSKKFDYKLLDQYNHSIVDSGLFTLMFGGDKSSQLTQEDFYDYMINYCKWINERDWKNTSFVECDVQKKLSSETAWEFRKEMKKIVNKGTIINVYHLEDENPDKLIDFSDYIAISIPELRFNLSDKERWNITKYIATKSTLKGKRVHLLGCTEKKYLEYFQFCFSCDSTSWTSPFRYGEIKTRLIKTKVKDLETYKENYDDLASFCSFLYKLDYQKQCGKQY